MSEPLMTSEEVAQILRKSKEWVERMARAKRIPCHPQGRTPMFTREDVDAYIDSTAVGAVDANPWGLTERSASKKRAS